MDGDCGGIESVEERAKKLAELTGREYKDVLTDLLDDGKLNQSNVDESPDLVEQLKGAAELIATVQNISKDIQDNTVLNGGENETVLEVKTTLEGDVVDRAIASVQRKAENIKKIALIILPVFLLITGGTMSNMGVFNSDESQQDYENDNCNPDWNWFNSYANLDNENDLVVYGEFNDDAHCNYDMQGMFVFTINKDGAFFDDFTTTETFEGMWSQEHRFTNLPEGEYDVELAFDENGDSWWHWNVEGGHTIESNCITDMASLNSWAEVYDNNSIEVHMQIANYGVCDEEVEIGISVYLETDYQFSLEPNDLGTEWIYGSEMTIIIRHDDFTNLGDGNWSFETRFTPLDESEECCEMTEQVEINTTPEPEPCNGSASFYSVSYEWRNETNDTINLKVLWDADWSCDETQEIEIDLYLKDENDTILFGDTFIYNTTFNSLDRKTYTITNITKPTNGHKICLAIWVEVNDWRLDNEWNETLSE